ncbi:alpha/beta hydrolase [Treponema brennaborense]|uniref:Acetyl hydrolase, putative n=1 Tax=Treponema brennaborense (strain DSM 12168 / CIP 105900 / DD5/3) TaxID=906968 RepID=F4LK64_TREBD|nr:alpha/beta hydrolase [Treponema brennaborense]AEE17526.1 acetyl hydrolase, putative [Treponema brennaborense DSM 12168]
MRFSAYRAEDGGGAGKPDKKKALKKLKTLVFTSKNEPEPFRKKIEETFNSPFIPAKVECRDLALGTVPCDILTPEVCFAKRIILYIHGGSFIGGSRFSWRSFCASFAAEATSRLVVPEYRLAPQHPYPAALEDVQTVFREIYTKEQSAGKDEPEFIIAADGAGASIALALVQTLRDKYRQSIRNIMLFSPWLDLTAASLTPSEKKRSDDIINADCIKRSGSLYTYESNLKNPLVSPLYMPQDKIADFPPVYVQCGGAELLLRDVRTFQEKLKAAGRSCTVDVWPDMMFMFQMADADLPQAHFAVQRAGKYIQTYDREQDGPQWNS